MSPRLDLSFASLTEIGARIRDGTLSPVALTEHCLARIAAQNPVLNAFITVTGALALEQARQAEREMRVGQLRGALHGVPVAVKDFYDSAGIRTTAGFEHFEHRVPSQDADIVVRLREAGAVLIGKTNMHKLGMGTTSLDSHFGPVVNPWSPDHVAGGSSGGSAAALAAGLCFVTIDTDAVGSGRLPAAICGVACLKPTFGALSSVGILAGEPADPAILLLAHPCVMARSAEDVALALGALHDLPQLAFTERAAVRRVGVVRNFAAGGDVRDAFAAAVAPLSTMDIETRDIEAPFSRASFDVRDIERDRATIDGALFGDVDAIMLPTLAGPTPTVADARAAGHMAVSPDNTFFCNYFGLPAISVPTGLDSHRLPRSVQFAGPRGSDARLLALAMAYQRAWGRRVMPPQG